MQDQGLVRDDGTKYLRTGTVVFLVYGMNTFMCKEQGASVQVKTVLKCFQTGQRAAIYAQNCYSKNTDTYSAAGVVYEKVDMQQIVVE